MIKKDVALTKARQFVDKRSYVGFRIHPGSKHVCEYLFGIDASKRREEIHSWYDQKCAECGHYCGEYGHLHHIIGGRGLQRCWCMENLIWLCAKCHHDKHVQVSWRSWAKKEEQTCLKK